MLWPVPEFLITTMCSVLSAAAARPKSEQRIDIWQWNGILM